MRVVSGKYKGRIIKGFDIDGTRPTMDRVKESLFAMINYKLKGATVLDLFAGSGNLGIEALSNGSTNAYFIDHNKIAIKTINDNIRDIKILENTYVYKMDYLDALGYFKENHIKFDIIFLDPPYGDKILSQVVSELKQYDILKSNGIVVLEYVNEYIEYPDYKLLKTRKYGKKEIMILENK